MGQKAHLKLVLFKLDLKKPGNATVRARDSSRDVFTTRCFDPLRSPGADIYCKSERGEIGHQIGPSAGLGPIHFPADLSSRSERCGQDGQGRSAVRGPRRARCWHAMSWLVPGQNGTCLGAPGAYTLSRRMRLLPRRVRDGCPNFNVSGHQRRSPYVGGAQAPRTWDLGPAARPWAAADAHALSRRVRVPTKRLLKEAPDG